MKRKDVSAVLIVLFLLLATLPFPSAMAEPQDMRAYYAMLAPLGATASVAELDVLQEAENRLCNTSKEAAIAYLEEQIATQPESALLLSSLGSDYLDWDITPEKALACYQKAYQMEPDDIVIMRRFIYACGTTLDAKAGIPVCDQVYQAVLPYLPPDGEVNGDDEFSVIASEYCVEALTTKITLLLSIGDAAQAEQAMEVLSPITCVSAYIYSDKLDSIFALAEHYFSTGDTTRFQKYREAYVTMFNAAYDVFDSVRYYSIQYEQMAHALWLNEVKHGGSGSTSSNQSNP